MIQRAIARRYAKALFSLLPPSNVPGAVDVLALLAEAAVQSRDFRELLHNPLFSREQKNEVVRELAAHAGASATVERFLLHLARKNRMSSLPEVSDAFADLADQTANRIAVMVSSARPLSPENLAVVRERLQQATGKTIDLTTKIDPHLIGGMEIQIGSTVYEGSVRGQLNRLRAALAKTG